MIQISKLGLALAIMLVFADLAHGDIWMEVGEAGQLPGSEQYTFGSGPLDMIGGTLLSFTGDADMFVIFVDGLTPFSATTVEGSSVDTQLFLFDPTGMGVLANDDTAGAGLQSTLPPTMLPTGFYCLAISSYNNDPFSELGLIFPSFPFTGVYGPTGPGGGSPVVDWSGGGGSGGYSIFLTGAGFGGRSGEITPEPGTLFMLAVGALGMLSFQCRRRKVA